TLRSRNEDGLPHGAIERRPRVSDDADDRPFNIAATVGMVHVYAKPPAECAAIRELLPDEFLADDRNWLRVGDVGIGEIAARHVRNTHGREESRCDRADLTRRDLP